MRQLGGWPGADFPLAFCDTRDALDLLRAIPNPPSTVTLFAIFYPSCRMRKRHTPNESFLQISSGQIQTQNSGLDCPPGMSSTFEMFFAVLLQCMERLAEVEKVQGR